MSLLPASVWTPGKTMDDVEKQAYRDALAHFDGNKVHAAKALGISIRTMRYKIHKFGLWEFRGKPQKKCVTCYKYSCACVAAAALQHEYNEGK